MCKRPKFHLTIVFQQQDHMCLKSILIISFTIEGTLLFGWKEAEPIT